MMEMVFPIRRGRFFSPPEGMAAGVPKGVLKGRRGFLRRRYFFHDGNDLRLLERGAADVLRVAFFRAVYTGVSGLP